METIRKNNWFDLILQAKQLLKILNYLPICSFYAMEQTSNDVKSEKLSL